MKSTLFVLFAAVFVAGSPQLALSAGFTAKGFDRAEKNDRVLFTADRTIAADGLSIRTVYNGTDGKELVIEKMEFDSAGAPAKYSVDHLQSGTAGSVEVKEKKLVFSYRSADGKVKSHEEDLPELWATGPLLIRMMAKHWESLMKGEALKFRFASWERAETVGFEIFKDGQGKTSDGRDVVIMKMKPSSFIIAALVKPIYFEMRPDGSFIEAMNGRTLPKKAEGEKFKDLDAR
ncbi:MAG: hypothetical protein KGQ59_02600, partial [Bdellovibrionales bacterium]|nr:hypothetical protein [Bdellovibrionales bacterium]